MKLMAWCQADSEVVTLQNFVIFTPHFNACHRHLILTNLMVNKLNNTTSDCICSFSTVLKKKKNLKMSLITHCFSWFDAPSHA